MPELKNWNISDFLSEAVKTHGDAPALKFKKVIWSYRELDRISDRYAAGLLGLGITRGTHVAFLTDPGPSSIALFYAVQKIGAVAAMICTTLSPEEAVEQLGLCDAEFLAYSRSGNDIDLNVHARLAQEKASLKKIFFLGRKPEGEFPGVDWLMAQGFDVSAEKLAAAKAAVLPGDTAGILFTSGTTSQPKAVMTSHFSRINNGIQEAQSMHCTSADRFCVSLPMYHCFCISTMIMAACAVGACLCIPRSRHTSDLLRTMSDERCTIFTNVPTLFHAIISRSDLFHYDFTSLRTGIIGGSTYSQELFTQIEQAFGYKLMCSLGQTECTGGITACNYDDPLSVRISTVGHMFEHVEGKIIDIQDGHKTLPTGEKGEFCVRGYLLMQGYYKRPDLTAKTIDADGWLHTGDMGFFDAAGNLTLTGRIKDLIIRGGENIAPAEIENALSLLPEIQECKVLGVPDEHYGEEICACVIPAPGSEPTAESVRAELTGRLASFKMPRYVVTFQDFPRTGSGKTRPTELKKQAVARLKLDK